MVQGKGVFRRGNVWWLRFADATGKIIRESSKTNDYKTALKDLAKRRGGSRRRETHRCAEIQVTKCSPRLQPIVTIALNTGMRRGEILGLTWGDVDMRNGFIMVGRSKNGERREIPMNGAVKDVFARILRRLDSE